MKLYYSVTSPYARKVRLVIEEKGLQSAIDCELIDPFADLPQLLAANPLGRVPTLLLDDGQALYGSQVICAYLDSQALSPVLVPAEGWARWQVLRHEALADGLIDAAYDIVMERKREAPQRSSHWLEHWSREIRRALDAMEKSADELDTGLSLAHLATAAALGYLELRMPEMLSRDGADGWESWPRLCQWYASFSLRPSMQATRPGD